MVPAKLRMDSAAKSRATKTMATKYGMSCAVIDKEDQLTRDEWLEERKKGVGGSDVPDIVGSSKWGSKLTQYREKVGLSEGVEQTEQMEIGAEIEDFICGYAQKKIYMKDSKAKVINCRYMLERTEDGFPARANLDRLVQFNGVWGILEIKNASFYVAKNFEGKVPDNYYDQCQWYMYVTGIHTFAILVALVGGNSLKNALIAYDPERVEFLKNSAKAFWVDHVIPRVMPEPLSALDYKAVDEDLQGKEAYPGIMSVEEDEVLGQLCADYAAQKNAEKVATERKKVLGARIKKYLTDKLSSQVLENGKKILGLTFVKGRASLDKKTFKEEDPVAFEAYEKHLKTGNPTVQIR
jgi:putative phage-type endonuclease